ncbi:MAG TPA: protein-tyrosine-phosphatase [Saprospiraceae bacterium]|nr:protein-tyrosine-phosphatase [Saprospiraceae bacterium]
MYPILSQNIENILQLEVSKDRKSLLQPLMDYIQNKVDERKNVNLNFICTHNSRRSHLSQVWAQTAAAYFGIDKVYCYSGGTEATAVFPKIIETLQRTGFEVLQLSENNNPVYAFKFSADSTPIMAFSKKYDHGFNPALDFAAIMTCSSADEDCPIVFGSDLRIPMTFDDPKAFDNTPLQDEKYMERSLQIASEIFYICSQIKTA